ncbi:MAG: multiheme c-type cytochrome, partial [Myxococcota bacterium]
MIALLWWACARVPPPPPPPPTIAERFGDRPFLVPIDAPPTVALVAGGSFEASAAGCGACHPDHLAEWQGSTHASAVLDPQYLGELAKPGQPRWLCLNCHLPTRPQRAAAIRPDTPFARAGDITVLAAPAEPSFDPARVREGVSCPTCHVRRDDDGEGVVVGPRGSGRAPHR